MTTMTVRCALCGGSGACDPCQGYGVLPESAPYAEDGQDCPVCDAGGVCPNCAGIGETTSNDDQDSVAEVVGQSERSTS